MNLTPPRSAAIDAAADSRQREVNAAFTLELFTVIYMLGEACAALGIGLATRSVSLQTFGLDSLIEIASALVLVWRLNIERQGRASTQVDSFERRAELFVGWTLLGLAGYILFGSLYGLYERQSSEASIWGIALAVTSLVVMPILARLKLRYADRIDSRALRADAFETIACAYLSFTLLLGVGANYLLGWWWADPIAALVMLYFILREAREALTGEEIEKEGV